MARKKSFVINTFSNVGISLVTQVIGFFLIPIFVRELGQELYGIWVLSISIMGYFSVLEFGASGGVVKYISESKAIDDHRDISETINTSIVFYLVVGLVIFLLINIYISEIIALFNISVENINTANNILRISSVVALFAWPNKVIASSLDGILKYLPKNILLGIQSILSSVIIIILAIFEYKIELILIISSLTQLIPWIGNYILLKKGLKGWRFSYASATMKKLKEIFNFSIWVLIQQLVAMAVYKIDQTIIAIYLPVSFVTVYVVITKLFFIVHRVTGTLFKVIWPYIFSAKKMNDGEFISKVVTKGCKYTTLIIVPLSALGVVVSPKFIELWMGPEYSIYSFWTQLLFLSWFVSPMFGVIGNVLIGIGKIKLINVIGVIGASINVILSIYFTKTYGFGGVILGTLIVNIGMLPVIFPIYTKALGISWKIILYPNLIIISNYFIIMLPFYWLINQISFKSIWELIIFSIFYLLINYLTILWRYLDIEDKNDLSKNLGFMKVKGLWSKVIVK
jgi:O-antigen/teichoic acid export membrane protein